MAGLPQEFPTSWCAQRGGLGVANCAPAGVRGGLLPAGWRRLGCWWACSPDWQLVGPGCLVRGLTGRGEALSGNGYSHTIVQEGRVPSPLCPARNWARPVAFIVDFDPLPGGSPDPTVRVKWGLSHFSYGFQLCAGLCPICLGPEGMVSRAVNSLHQNRKRTQQDALEKALQRRGNRTGL